MMKRRRRIEHDYHEALRLALAFEGLAREELARIFRLSHVGFLLVGLSFFVCSASVIAAEYLYSIGVRREIAGLCHVAFCGLVALQTYLSFEYFCKMNRKHRALAEHYKRQAETIRSYAILKDRV